MKIDVVDKPSFSLHMKDIHIMISNLHEDISELRGVLKDLRNRMELIEKNVHHNLNSILISDKKEE